MSTYIVPEIYNVEGIYTSCYMPSNIRYKCENIAISRKYFIINGWVLLDKTHIRRYFIFEYNLEDCTLLCKTTFRMLQGITRNEDDTIDMEFTGPSSIYHRINMKTAIPYIRSESIHPIAIPELVEQIFNVDISRIIIPYEYYAYYGGQLSS